MNAIKRSEQRINEAHQNNEQSARIQEIELEHIDKLKDMLAEPMSSNIVEDSFE
jgi:hypothetical protein